MQLFTSSALIVALAGAAVSQVKVETFDGPALPAGWTARSGSWSIVNGRAVQGSAVWGYLTLDNVMLTNCVLDVDVYWGSAGITFGGVAARHPGTAADDAVMVKVQQNTSTSSGFDSVWNYERPSGGALALTSLPPMQSTRIRLIALGSQGWLQLDSTQDGIYDTVLGPKPYTAHLSPGLVGITAFTSGGSAALDNFALFDAVLVESSGSLPKVGTTYTMEMTTQATMITPFVCAAALSNGTKNGNLGGIPIGNGRRIPLAVDPMLSLSLSLGGALGLVGITDAQGLGKPTFVIPNLPALIGLRVSVAGFTLGGASGIDNISNDHSFVIQA